MSQGEKSGRISGPYKHLTLPMLQVFREVARSGSQAAAARRLGLAQPTVWEQMRALERLVGMKLLNVTSRNSQLTEDGLQLLNLSLPLLEGFESLPKLLSQRRTGVRQHLRIAATPRCLQEDLPDCVVEFQSKFPDVRLSIVEASDADVLQKALDHEIDIGISPADRKPELTRHLRFELAYETDLFLIVPLDHPLAKKKMVLPEDITAYPIVNGPGTFYGQRMKSVEAGLDLSVVPPQISVFTVATIRRFVKLGFGIGIVPKRSRYPADPELHERSISKHAGRTPIFAITPRYSQNDLASEFVSIIRKMLK